MSQQATHSEVSVRTGDDRRTLATTSQQQQQRKQQNRSRRSKSPKRSRLQFIADNNSNIVVSAPNPIGHKRLIPFSSNRLVPCYNDNCNQPTNDEVHKCVGCNSTWHLQCSGLNQDDLEVTLVGGRFKCKECIYGKELILDNNKIKDNNNDIINNINSIWKENEINNKANNNNYNINGGHELDKDELVCDSRNCIERSVNMGINCTVCDNNYHPKCIGIENKHWIYFRDLGCRLQDNSEFICSYCDFDKYKLFILNIRLELDKLNIKKNEESIEHFNSNNNNNNELSQQSVLSSQWSQSIPCTIPFTAPPNISEEQSLVPDLEMIPVRPGVDGSSQDNNNNNNNSKKKNSNNNNNNKKLDKQCKRCKRCINFANDFDYLLFNFDVNKLCIECNSKKEFEYTCIHKECNGNDECFSHVNKLLDHIHARHGEVNEWIKIFKIRKCIEYGCMNRIIGSESHNNSDICRKHKYLKRIHDNEINELDNGNDYGDEKIEIYINCEECNQEIKIKNRRLLLVSKFRKYTLCDGCIYKQSGASPYKCIHSNCKNNDIEYNVINKLYSHILVNHIDEKEWLKTFNISRCSIKNCNLKALKKSGVCAKHYFQEKDLYMITDVHKALI